MALKEGAGCNCLDFSLLIGLNWGGPTSTRTTQLIKTSYWLIILFLYKKNAWFWHICEPLNIIGKHKKCIKADTGAL